MKKKIVFLDASTIDYGDIDFTSIKTQGDFKLYATTKPDEVIERAKDATIVIANKIIFDKNVLDECKSLRLIAVTATGYNIIDIEHAKKKGISVANVPGYSTFSVAQHTLTFMLALSANLLKYNQASHDGTWAKSNTFTLSNWPTLDLSNKILGILGMGAIGKKVAEFAKAFDMRIVALRRKSANYTNDDFERVDLNRLAEISDFITIHMPLTSESKYIIDKEFFKKMKKTAFLINMARGHLVKPDALEWALRSGKIAGAAIDVMEKEPPDINDPLLKSPNLIITPHTAWASIESRKKLIQEIAKNIESFLNGEKRNIVVP